MLKYTAILFITIWLAVGIFLISGCAKSNNQTSPTGNNPIPPTSSRHTTPDINSVTSSIYTTAVPENSEPPYRTDGVLTISKAPKLNETADLIFVIKVVRSDANIQPFAGLARSKAWIDFYWTNTQGSYSEAYSSIQVPSEEVTISGELPWQGSYSEGLTLHSQIKLTREGVWRIQARFYGEGWQAGAGNEIEVAVANGTAAIMGTEDFKTGLLAYLGNLTYEGGVWPPPVPNEMYPVSLGLDISKAPRAGEVVNLSCRIRSVIDLPDVSIAWSLLRRLGDTAEDLPETDLLSSTDLAWNTDLKKNEPIVFSTTIKFPTEGDWELSATGKSGTKYITGSGHRLKLSITSSKSYFGWAEQLVKLNITDKQAAGVKAIYKDKVVGKLNIGPQSIGPATGPSQDITPLEEPVKPKPSTSAIPTVERKQALLDNGWTEIMSEDFEGVFPTGNWEVSGNPTWDDDDYKPNTIVNPNSSYSAWCANGGTNGRDPQYNN
jgi:hypothetical protein